ncbi:MAG: SEFIR domain-containing protein [Acidobacteriota bacterium]
MDRPTAFISYSQDSKVHCDRVLRLADRLRRKGVDVSVDQYVNGAPEQGWPRWMAREIEDADFVLLVCTEAYRKRFLGIDDRPGRGLGADWEGSVILNALHRSRSRSTKFIPILFDADPDAIPAPLQGTSYYRPELDDSFQDLYDALLGQAGVGPAPLGPLERRPRPRGSIPSPSPSPRIAPSRLPTAPAELLGRGAELEKLDAAWADPATHLVTLVAWGGVGKTSLVGTWAGRLAARDFDADSFDWSFYSQGTRDQTSSSSDPFIDAALRFFGGADMADSSSSPWTKASRLAELVAERRALLVLDGLEPLQHPPGPLRGQLKDGAMQTLLRGLAARNAGLCVVTTRESVTDLGGFRSSTAPEWTLERLSTDAGIQLLGNLGVRGPRAELEALVDDVRGHALTLRLLGQFLHEAFDGDVRRRDRVDFREADASTQGGHAFRVMEAYERWLEASGDDGVRQIAILRLLGLFDRVADAGCLDALRKRPAIPGLTETLVTLKETQWKQSVSRLEQSGLLLRDGDALDAHPLVREYFAARLQNEGPAAWRAGHGRLFDHLKDTAEPQPDTLEGLQALYQAVAHGCRAGRQHEACTEVYRERILRGTGKGGYYTPKKLGAVGADLGAVASFFDETWRRVSPVLNETDRAWLLNQAGVRLRALGRLGEAAEPFRAGLAIEIHREDWKQAAVTAGHLSELELIRGYTGAAVRDAGRAVDLAGRSGDAFQRMSARAKLANSLHHAGRSGEALEQFRSAEAIQTAGHAKYPELYSLPGFRYCTLLLADAAAAAGGRDLDRKTIARALLEVERRATEALNIVTDGSRNLLDRAVSRLTLGRVHFYRALLDGSPVDIAGPDIEAAVDGLRHAGRVDYLPGGLLTRAWFRFSQGRPDDARADLDEAREVADQEPMPLFLADIALYRARFFRDRVALSEARRLIDAHGYGRRLQDIEALEAASAKW